MTPEEIETKTFTTVRLREGYDPDEVDAFLDKVAASVGELRQQLADAQQRARAAETQPIARVTQAVDNPVPPKPLDLPVDMSYETALQRLETPSAQAVRILEIAQSAAEKLERETKASCMLELEKTRQEATQTLAEAQKQASARISEAETAYSRVIEGLTRDKDELITSITNLEESERTTYERFRASLERAMAEIPSTKTIGPK